MAARNVAWIEAKIAAQCACRDPICAVETGDELGEWILAHLGDARLDEAQRQRLREGLATFVACLGSGLASGVTAAQAMVALRSFETRLCACTDAACVERTTEEMIATAKKYEHIKASEAETTEAAAIIERVTACAAKMLPP